MKYENSVKSKNKPFSVRIGSFRSRVETYMQFSYILMIKKNSESQQKNSSISSKQNESSETTKADF